MRSRRPGERFNRGRIAAGGATAGGFPPGGTLLVTWTSPADASTIPINSATLLTGLTNVDADTVQVFSAYPTDPIGSASVVNGVWSLSYTPDLLAHGSYTFTAEASRGVDTETADRSINVTAVPQPGTWATNNGAVWDFRFLTETPGTVAPTVTPIEGSGNLVPTNGPVVRNGIGNRNVIEFVTASSQYMAAANTTPNGTRQPWTIAVRCLASVGSARIGGFGHSANALDYAEITLNSGKVPQVLTRAGTAGGGAQTGSNFAFDFDVPSLTSRVLVFTSNGTQVYLYEESGGVMIADANNPIALDTGAFALAVNRVLIGARPVSTLAGYLTGQIQWLGVRATFSTLSDAQAIYSSLVASDQAAPVGTPFMFLGHSLIDGGSSGGWRKPIVDYWAANSQVITAVGPYTGGVFSNNAHNGQGGNNMAAMISQQITPYIGSGKAYQPRACAIMVWANDVDDGNTSATYITRYTNFLDALHTAGVSGDAAFRIIASNTCEPYDPAQSASAGARITELNAGLIAGVHDAFDLAHPSNTIIRWDAYAAIGGWTSGSYGTDRVHPLPGASGYYKFANDATNGVIQACAAYFASIG